MTDGQLLFIVFAALYLIECVRWLPAPSWVCIEGDGGRWHFRRPSVNAGARGGGMFFLSPLQPCGTHVVMTPWIFVPAADGLLVRGEDGTATRIAWEKLDPHADDSLIVIPGHTPVLMPGHTLAAEWSARLCEWRGMDDAARTRAFLTHAAQSLDAGAFQKLGTALAARTRLLRGNGAMIFVWCFGVVSALHAWFGEDSRLWLALALLLVMQIVQAFLFVRATREAVPGGTTVAHRFWKALSITLLPQHSALAANQVCRACTAAFHPLAAHGIVDDAAFIGHARRFWRLARYEGGARDEDALPIEAVALKRFFKSAGIDLATLDEAPARQPGSAKWCPRCHAQYQAGAHECPDCAGVVLREFLGED